MNATIVISFLCYLLPSIHCFYDPFFDEYRHLDDINTFLSQIKRKHSNIVTIKTIGWTFQNRRILAVEILPITDVDHMNVTILECGIHPLEWISPASCLWIVNQAVQGKFSSLNWG